MNKNIVWLIVIIILIIIGFWYWGGSSAESVTPITPATKENLPAAVALPSVQAFTVAAKDFSYSLSEIRVKKGETVRLTLNNQGGWHDWRVDGYAAATKVIAAGQSETIQFLADKAGIFDFYCSVGNHRAMGMKGKLIVE